MEITDKTKEITDWFHAQNNNKVAYRQTLVQYATDLMEGEIVAKNTQFSDPFNYIYWELLNGTDADFAFRYLQFYITEKKKSQSKMYWDKYIVLPHHLQFLEKYPNPLEYV